MYGSILDNPMPSFLVGWENLALRPNSFKDHWKVICWKIYKYPVDSIGMNMGMCARTKTQVSNKVVSTSGSIINKTQKETLGTLAGILGGID